MSVLDRFRRRRSEPAEQETGPALPRCQARSAPPAVPVWTCTLDDDGHRVHLDASYGEWIS